MAIVNLTPHEVTLHLDDDPMGEKIAFPASGDVARLATIELGALLVDDVLVDLVEFHHIENPPPVIEGRWYIVSLPTALAQPRGDFLVPFREVRDDGGRIVGCRALARPV